VAGRDEQTSSVVKLTRGFYILSIQKKVLLNTASQVYMALLSVVTLPFYISVMGKPSYGLIAFFLQLQTVISLLDIGISATVSRNMTLFKISKLSRADFLTSSRSVEFIFYIIGFSILAIGWLMSGWMTFSWLDIEDFNPQVAHTAVQMIIVVVFFRWLQTFYRAVIFGAERIEWVSWFNILFSTIRVAGVIPFLLWIDGTIVDFFWFQIVLNFIELVILYLMASRLIGYQRFERFAGVRLTSMIVAIKSASIIGLTSLIWAVIAQADKFIASGVISLTAYAAYSIVITVASVMVLVSAPLIYAIGPMMARLLAQQQTDEAVQLFRNASLFTALLLSASFAVMVVDGSALLYAWTGDAELTKLASPLLPAYIAGTFFFALNYLSYSICYALGDFRRRMHYSIVALVIYAPMLFVACHFFGEYGLVYSWLCLNILFFFFAQPVLYSQLKSGLFAKSLRSDLIPPFIGCFSVFGSALLFERSENGPWQVFLWSGVMFGVSMSVGLSLSRARLFVKPLLMKLLWKSGHDA